MAVELKSTKISGKFHPIVWNRFNQMLSFACIARDPFLDSILNREIAYLDKELGNRRMSAIGKRYVSNQLDRMTSKGGNLVPASIALRKTTAAALEDVVKRTNICRDSFLNRLVFFLSCERHHLKALDLPVDTAARSLSGVPSLPVGPLEAINEIVFDPFFFIRRALEDDIGVEGIYTMPLGKGWEGFSCYLEEAQVPGTDAFSDERKKEAEWAAAFDDMFVNLQPKE